MTFDFRVPETVDLADADRKLTDVEESDAIHRAGFPRSAITDSFRRGDQVTAVVTGWAADTADARCGVPVDLPPGSHPGRGTLRWYRHYIARLDECADRLTPGWRHPAMHDVGPYPWCEVAFGPVTLHGRRAPAPGKRVSVGYDRDQECPRVVGHWTFDLPSTTPVS